MKMRNSLAAAIMAAITAVVLAIAAPPAKAATINWGAAQNIVGSSDVDTTGTLFASANFGSGTSVTVNSVTFNPFTASGTSTTVGNITLASTSGQNLSVSGDPLGGPPSYNGLLEAANFTGGFPTTGFRTQSITLSNLLLGATYSIQYWVNDSRAATTASRTVNVGSVTLAANVAQSGGGLGQYTIGQFIADSTTQSFSVAGNFNVAENGVSAPYANAMQVRLLAVPEPETLAMAGVGVASAVMGRELRRRKKVTATKSGQA
jgi:hypothetical protein